MGKDIKVHEIQDRYCSSYDKRKLCSYDIEFIDRPTKPLIHQTARFWFFLKGKGSIVVDGNDYPIKENTFVAILPWETTEINEVSEPLHFIKIVYNSNFLIDHKSFYNPANEFVSLLEPISRNPVLYLTDKEVEEIRRIMDSIKNEVGTDSLYDNPESKSLSNIYVTNKLMELLIDFNRYSQKIDLKQKNGQEIALDNRNMIFKYIYSHISENLNLGKLSEVFYLSESTISRYITSVTGMSFSDLTKEMRITKATDLLTYTDLTVNDIASLVGFADASHLIKVFNEKLELSPSQYRKLYKARDDIFKEKDKSFGFELLSYINEHYTDDLKISDVAEKFKTNIVDINMTLMYLAEKNFDNLLNYLRVNKACELLLSTDISVIDVAYEVGYNNPKTFTRNFERLKNTSPGDFRRTYNLQIGSESIPKED